MSKSSLPYIKLNLGMAKESYSSIGIYE